MLTDKQMLELEEYKALRSDAAALVTQIGTNFTAAVVLPGAIAAWLLTAKVTTLLPDARYVLPLLLSFMLGTLALMQAMQRAKKFREIASLKNSFLGVPPDNFVASKTVWQSFHAIYSSGYDLSYGYTAFFSATNIFWTIFAIHLI